MSQTENNLEQVGTLAEFSLAELLLEAVQARLSGAFRLAKERQKIAVYLSDGEILHAASNIKHFHLPEAVVRWRVFSAEDLQYFQSAASEYEWSAKMVAAGKLNPSTLQALQARQTTEILQTALSWTNGEWSFSPLVRLREEIRAAVNLETLAIETARKFSAEYIAQRFKREDESFIINNNESAETFDLLPEEAFVLSRFDGALRLDELQSIGSLPDDALLRAVYVLWLGGLLKRFNNARAFSDAKLKQIAAVKIAPTETKSAETKTESKIVPETQSPKIEVQKPLVELPIENPQAEIEDYLSRVETAEDYYQILAIGRTADAAEIKRSYLDAAKRFHPDKFRQSDFHARLQNAFTNVAQAHETLKDPKTREVYDYKLKKTEIANPLDSLTGAETAEQLFERGMDVFRGGKFTDALTLFARAVQLAPDVAEYHARYAQALGSHPKLRLQAESEFTTALRLEPNNTEFRLLLAEFYRDHNLMKRAEAEASRVLIADPNNQRARRLLDSLRVVDSK